MHLSHVAGTFVCSVVASLLLNRDFSDGSHDWWRGKATPANAKVKEQRVVSQLSRS